MKDDISEYGWKVKFNHEFPEKPSPYVKLNYTQLRNILPLSLRYLKWYCKRRPKKYKAYMDYLKMTKCRQIYGAPVGGIGSGTIGRCFRGGFCRFQIEPGIYKYDEIEADQFIVTVHDLEKRLLYNQVLSTKNSPRNRRLSSWKWNFPSSRGEYSALYPRSWTRYNLEEVNLILKCKQISPIIPHNYKDSCLPVTVFDWSIFNFGEQNVEVTITFTFRNGIGNGSQTPAWTQSFRRAEQQYQGVTGMLIHQEDVNISFCPYFNPSGSGKRIWSSLAKVGNLNSSIKSVPRNEAHSAVGVAIAGNLLIAGGETKSLQMSLAWHMPIIRFGCDNVKYTRRYSKWFSKNPEGASKLIHYALNEYSFWEREIDTWQLPILGDLNLPPWFKSAIFNELYYIADGGSQWIEIESTRPLVPDDPRIQHDIADAILIEDNEICKSLAEGHVYKRKVRWTVPHDIGDPVEQPFKKVYRDYACTGNMNYLQHMWEICLQLITYCQQWDSDGDGMIENEGYADQTYDLWTMKGTSAYCGGLWLAALFSCMNIADILHDEMNRIKFKNMLELATESYNKKLWTGCYYRFDENSDIIMSDQLCGFWMLATFSNPYEIISSEKVQSALQTIYKYNVLKFNDGRIGALNGSLPGRDLHHITVQSEESWAGVSYALAGIFIFANLTEEGWNTAEGTYRTVWEQRGLSFQTPEAIYTRPYYRSLGYMRPLSIFSILQIIQRKNYILSKF